MSGDQNFSYFHLGGTDGYQYSENLPIEGVATISVGDDKDETASQILGQSVRTQFTALSGYLVEKTSGDFYVRSRLGLSYATFLYTAGGYDDEAESALGLSYGLGFRVDYTIISEVEDPLFNNESYDSSTPTLSLVFDI